MNIRNMIVAFVFFTLAFGMFAPMSGASSSQSECARSGCHDSSFYQYFTILPDHERSSIPEDMKEGENFLMSIELENDCSEREKKYNTFDWTELTFSFDSDSITASRPVIRTGELRPGTRTYYATLTCNRVEPVIVTVDAVGHNSHENARSTDQYIFAINAVIQLSSYTMDPRETDRIIDFVPTEDIDRLEVNISSELEGFTNITPMNLTDLAEGSSSTISLHMLDPTAQGTIQFTWWAGNRTGTVNFTIEIPSESSGSADDELFVLVGRATGIFSFILLIVSTLLCLNVKSWKRFLLGKLGKKRLLLHCYVSYGIVGLSLIHLVILRAGGKYSSAFKYEIFMTGSKGLYYNLGHVALYAMIGLGLTGIFQKRMMTFFKKHDYIPYATWRLIHLLLTVIALILVIVHLVMIGTDFSWIR